MPLSDSERHSDTSVSASSTNSTTNSRLPTQDTDAQSRPMPATLKPQLIERAFVDQKKLVQTLQSRYGTNNFKVQLRLNRYTLFVPEMLSEREINQCCW